MANNDFSIRVNTIANQLDYIAYNLTKDSEDAKDLIQETIFKALVNHDRFNQGTNLKAWLYTIMKNIFINNYRRESKRRVIGEETRNLAMAEISYNVAGNKGESELALKEIENELNGVDEAIRIPFLMHFEGYKYDEIAEHMKIPLGTVKSRIFFARKELQKRIKRH